MLTRFALLASTIALAQNNWPNFGNDPGAMRYSPLKQITSLNAAQLKPAWVFRLGKQGSEAVPVVIDGVMYINGADGVYALVPETGELLWKYDVAPVAIRGLAYWPGASQMHPRLFTGNGHHLLAIDATTGKPAPGFGNEGRVDLKKGVLDGLNDGRYQLQSPPAVIGDVVVTGSSNGEGAPTIGAYGDIRGWDARTGKLLWTFHSVPRPGESGAETWPDGAWKNRSGTNVWGFFTVDVKRGIVYAPLGSPTNDFYGADRVGDNLYGNSLVALDAKTGERKWHRQLVHHDIWDYDLAAPPALFDIRRDGKIIPAVAQITKMGLLFVFDRVTGEPVYGVEEREVPQTIIPGEVTSKTQPFPVKPHPIGKDTFSIDELYDLSQEHARFCKELFETNKMKIGPAYSTLPLEGNVLFFPSTLGGGNWGGVSVDPAQQLLFVNVMHVGQWGHMEKRGNEYVRTSAYGTYARFWNRETRIPCNKPPFGELIAVDLPTGDVKWRKPLGRIESLEKLGVKNTGTLNLGGSIATGGGVVFIGATNDSYMRAFESRTGKMLWEEKVEAPVNTSPMTFLGRDGRQYVVALATGGGGFLGGGLSNTVVAWALPNAPRKPLPKAVSLAVKAAAEKRKGLPKVGAHAPLTLPTGGVKALVDKSCGATCHSIEVVTSQRLSKDDWNAIVRGMIARGAPVADAQIDSVVDYLSTALGR